MGHISNRLLIFGLVGATAACGASSTSTSIDGSDQGTIQVEASTFTFPSIEAMADASDFIVVGTVTEVGEGEFEPAPESEDFKGTQALRAIILIDETLKGGKLEGETVAFRWYGYEVNLDGSKGPQMIVEGQPPPVVGDNGLWFLIFPDSGSDLALTAFEGRLVVDADSRLNLVAPVDSGAATEIDGISLAELKAIIGANGSE